MVYSSCCFGVLLVILVNDVPDLKNVERGHLTVENSVKLSVFSSIFTNNILNLINAKALLGKLFCGFTDFLWRVEKNDL